MIGSDRIPCINPRCRRTASAEKYEAGEQIVCRACFRSLPQPIRDRYRQLRNRERRLLRHVERRVAKGTITLAKVGRLRAALFRCMWRNWDDIRRRFTAPEVPVGLENFLQEAGLA
ncbi:MAG: hypothetical protein GEU91_14115 [Rhizobiales bacterium]|nr:hypothetical protein [Hyphomicrobiales bacterium]